MRDIFTIMPIHGFYFCAIFVLCLSSWIALRKKIRKGSPKLILPLLALAACVAYEFTHPPEWNIRIDLFPIILFILPTLVLTSKRFCHPINENHGK
ncbi:MAG: hypothetical protein WC661_21870 [Opitutaceae bacterium]|jgi:hypothetical protein